jgi:ribonuclease BN (tRNA processing enzyme)
VDVTFFGVRGSTPCSSDAVKRYGGNTSCVAIERPGRDPIIFDLGTGLRFFGVQRVHEEPFRGHALLSHLHWDHVQGIPFFTPLLSEGARLDIYGPPQERLSLEEAVRCFVAPPYFPVGVDQLPCQIEFHEADGETFHIDDAEIRNAPVPHIGPTLGFRVTIDGVSVAYVSDHQQPGIGASEVAPEVVELCEGVDLLIHDAQFDDLEFSMRSDWGHCTVDYAVEVAARAGVKALALFHHDPSHSDSHLDELLSGAGAKAAERGVGEVIAAHEGLTINFGAGLPRAVPDSNGTAPVDVVDVDPSATVAPLRRVAT